MRCGSDCFQPAFILTNVLLLQRRTMANCMRHQHIEFNSAAVSCNFLNRVHVPYVCPCHLLCLTTARKTNKFPDI